MRAKKSLGQHFLKSQKALRDIIIAGDISISDTVVEIGPGKGVLTEKLLEHAGHVIAIETDADMIPLLEERFADEIASNKLSILHQDILKTDLATLPTSYKVIANIPYYITGAIFEQFLSSDNQPETIVVLIQKEVADRIVARDNRESILSMSVKVYGTPRYISTVKKEYFSPKPKVDSAIIAIEHISKKSFTEPVDEQLFFNLIKKGFAHKRKKLTGNLSYTPEQKEFFTTCNINIDARAENLTLDQWLCLMEQEKKIR